MKTVAKIIRGVTVPPVWVAALLCLLYFMRDDVLTNVLDFAVSLLLLAIVPVLAYPLQSAIPALRPGGQQMKRKLAFVLSLLGYSAAFIFSMLREALPNLAYINAVYLSSVILLTLINVISPWRASGHACSVVGPVVLLTGFLGWRALLPGLFLIALSFWASIYLRRHTVRELLLGSATSVLASILMYPIFLPVFA